MTPDDATKYIGLPHRIGASGPDSFDCWHFLRYVLLTYFNKDMPDAPIGDEAACLALFKDKAESGQWRAVEVPAHGDCALMRGGRWPHVGIYLDIDGGGVLHSLEGHGVVWTRRAQLRPLGFGRTVYYRVTNV